VTRRTYADGTNRQQNLSPVIRGRKMVLNYTNGSPCPSQPKRRRDYGYANLNDTEIIDDDDDDQPIRRKTTIISMLCEREPLMPQLTLSFIASPDECTYIFEARTSAACAAIQKSIQTLSPAGVFGVIMIIAIMVYVVGGCVYSRVVLNQRGWRQLPNYGLWAGIFGFFKVRDTSSGNYSCVYILCSLPVFCKDCGLADLSFWVLKDIVIILTSSCTRFMPSRQGYSRVNGGFGGTGSGRSARDSESANRLIDELNEEWDD
jgi:cation-dependent mannose-6-phosphate receptor